MLDKRICWQICLKSSKSLDVSSLAFHRDVSWLRTAVLHKGFHWYFAWKFVRGKMRSIRFKFVFGKNSHHIRNESYFFMLVMSYQQQEPGKNLCGRSTQQTIERELLCVYKRNLTFYALLKCSIITNTQWFILTLKRNKNVSIYYSIYQYFKTMLLSTVKSAYQELLWTIKIVVFPYYQMFLIRGFLIKGLYCTHQKKNLNDKTNARPYLYLAV